MSWDTKTGAEHPQAVLFDLYGTLAQISIDTNSASVWNAFCAELAEQGIHADAAGLHARYDQLVRGEREKHGEAFVLDSSFFYRLLQVRQPEDGEVARQFGRRFRALSTKCLQLTDYALPLLRRVRERGCKLAIVSNTEATVTSYDLDELQLAGFFDAVVLSSAVGVKKPDRRIFEIALGRLGANAADCVFVGDDFESDYLGAQNAGIRCVLLSSGHHPAHIPCVRPELDAIVWAIWDERVSQSA
jgi:HAD superfamily hydrolase (TIGR01509 family)